MNRVFDIIRFTFFIWLAIGHYNALCQDTIIGKDYEKTKTLIVTDRITKDSLSHAINWRFRNALDSIKETGKFKKFIVSTILSSEKPQAGMLTKGSVYKIFDGRVIDTIFFNIDSPFDDTNQRKFHSWISRAGNNIHVNTRPWILSKYLLFHSGDTVSSKQLERNEFIIRSLNFISNAFFLIEPTSDNRVNIVLHAKDNFSIGAELDHQGTSNDSYASIYESNFLGLGDKFFLRTRYNIKKHEYFSSGDIGYTSMNVLGTFFDFTTMLGIGKDYHTLLLKANKEFITPADYAGGAEYGDRQYNRSLGTLDTTLNIIEQKMNLWAGKSFKLNSKDLSLYFTAKGENYKYSKRPPTNQYNNPYYHNRTTLLASIGLSKEHFYKGNLIYGYGYTEDIPYGYKVELVGGYLWSEYNKMPYFGASTSWGFRNKFGYYNVSMSAGSFYKGVATLERSVLNLSIFGFTNLISFGGRYDARIFLRSTYTTGHNMLSGEIQETWFGGDTRLKGLSVDSRSTTKLYASPEMVLFTPWSVLGFRIAPYAYLDMGTLGEDANPFKNRFYAVTGFGIRIRNQSLIFPTIQLRFSVMVRGYDNTSNGIFNLNGEQKLKAQRFNPIEPNIIELK